MGAELFDSYFHAISTADKKKTMEIIDKALEQGITAEDIIFKMVVPGINKMLESFFYEKKVALSRHFLATTIATEIVDKLLPFFKQKPGKAGTIILGTAFGDFHGLGKKIVGGFLRAHMFKVIDLGLNVRGERFIEEAVKNNAQVIGISSMMVHTALSVEGAKKVRKILKSDGLENSIKLIVGGAPYLFDANLYKKVEADTWAKDGLSAVQAIENLIKEIKK